jgi:hypothetical protein
MSPKKPNADRGDLMPTPSLIKITMRHDTAKRE